MKRIIIFFIISMLFGVDNLCSHELKNINLDNTSNDNTLYDLSLEMMKKISHKEKFFELRDEGLYLSKFLKNDDFESVFTISSLFYYINNNLKVDFKQESKNLLEYYLNQKQFSYLYKVWMLVHYSELYWNDFNSAFTTAKNIVDFARKNDHVLGVAISYLCFANCYFSIRQYDDAINLYLLANDELNAISESYLLCISQVYLAEVYFAKDNFDRALLLCDKVDDQILFMEKNKEFVNPYLKIKNLILRLAVNCKFKNEINIADSKSILSDYLIMYPDVILSEDIEFVEALYNAAKNIYSDFYEKMNKLIKLNIDNKRFAKVAYIYKNIGDEAYDNNDYEIALSSYRSFFIFNDSANVQLFTYKLKGLHKYFNEYNFYNTNDNDLIQKRQVELNEKLTKRLVVIIFVIAILIVLFLIVVFIYYKNSPNKESILRIRESENDYVDIDIEDKEFAVEFSDPKKQLFIKIQELLKDRSVLGDHNLTREMVAEKIGSNATYIAVAIRDNTDNLTFTAYINKKRVKYARFLMEKYPNMTLNDISDVAGFSSRSRFSNTFKDLYKITPGQYRSYLSQ